MPTQLSPGGSTFPYYYKGGEIHCFKFGSFHADEASLLNIMHAEEEFISKPGRQLRIWVDVYESELTDRVLVEMLGSLSRACQHISKLALVGCPFVVRWRIRWLSWKSGGGFPFPVRYFEDPEVAKTWLVSESS
jgi:hypothetical protein